MEILRPLVWVYGKWFVGRPLAGYLTLFAVGVIAAGLLLGFSWLWAIDMYNQQQRAAVAAPTPINESPQRQLQPPAPLKQTSPTQGTVPRREPPSVRAAATPAPTEPDGVLVGQWVLWKVESVTARKDSLVVRLRLRNGHPTTPMPVPQFHLRPLLLMSESGDVAASMIHSSTADAPPPDVVVRDDLLWMLTPSQAVSVTVAFERPRAAGNMVLLFKGGQGEAKPLTITVPK